MLNPTNIKSWICQSLEERERKHAVHKEQLSREHRFLRRRLEQLTTQTGLNLNGFHGLHGLSSSAPTGSSCSSVAAAAAALSKRRSVSECSVGTASSTSSTASSRNSDRSAGSPSVSESGKSFQNFSSARASYPWPFLSAPYIWPIAILFPRLDLTIRAFPSFYSRLVVFPLFIEARNYQRSLTIRKT